MNTTLKVPKNEIESEAEDHAEETRYAVAHHGKQLHPEPRKKEKSSDKKPHEPWQVD